MVKKIAFSGMKGRKKDTFVMLLAVVLSVLFIVTSINLFTSAQAARQIEKFERFGYWHSAFFNLEAKIADALEGQNPNASTMTFLGYDARIGQIASIPENHQDIGEFKMFEGKMPSAPNEIAFEYSQLQNFTDTIAVGDTIKVEQIYYINEYEVPSDLDPRLQAFIRDVKGTKDALAAQNERLARGAYSDYLASLADENHESHLFNKGLSETDEALTFEVFLEHFIKHSGDMWTYLYAEENPDYDGQAREPLFYPVGSNEYNTIDTEFVEDYRLDRVQKIIYYRRIDRKSSGYGPAFLEDSPEDGTKTLVELIQEFGKPYSDYVVVTREYQISGFFEDYSGIWESGEYVLPSAFVTEEEKDSLLGALQKATVVDGPSDLIKAESLAAKRIVFLKEAPENQNFALENLVTNTLSYPEVEPKADVTLTYGLLAMIFVGTAISIFQINYAQVKRRAKKLVLLKSIGMVEGQLMGLLLWEVLVVLILAIPIGAILGTTASYGLVFLIQRFSTFKVVFDVNSTWLLMGIGASIASVFLGMLIPLKVAKGVPLIGAMNVPPKRASKAHTHHDAPHKMKRLTFGRLMIQAFLNERKKTLITIGLYGIASIMVSSVVVLSFLAFKSYLYEALVPGRPDYYLTFNVGLNEFAIDDAVEAIDASGSFEASEVVLVGEQLRLYHPELMTVGRYQERNEGDNALGEMAFLDPLFGSEEEGVYSENAIRTKIYSYSENSETLRTLYDLAGVDASLYPFEAFERSSNQVILVVPYHDGGTKVSYDHRNRFDLDAPYPFEVGDALLVASFLESIKGDVEVKEEIKASLEVIGVVRGFEGIGIWPFTHTLDEPVLVTGRKPYRTLYPTTQYRKILSKNYINTQVENRNWMKFGKSFMSVTLKPGVDRVSANFDMDKAVYIPFNLYGNQFPSAFEYVSVEPTYLVNQSAFDKSLRMAVIFTTLGLSMAMIMLMAQYNIGLSKLENERDKIGVLQAIGVTRRSFKIGYALSGVGFSLIVITLTNTLLFSGMALVAAAGPGGLNAELSDLLWRFPWQVYGASQLAFLLLGTLVYYLPCLKIIKHQPIVNITAR